MEPWQQMVLECLHELADLEGQRRSWPARDGQVPAPAELACQLFDDTGLGELLASVGAFNVECDAVLRSLDRQLAQTDLAQSIQGLLDDPAWAAVTDSARTALAHVRRCVR